MNQQQFYLNTRILRKAHACGYSLQLFIRTFGSSVMLTRENFDRWMQTRGGRQERAKDVRWLIDQIDTWSRVPASKQRRDLRFYQPDWFEFRPKLDWAWQLDDDQLYAFLEETVIKWHNIRTRLSIPSIEEL